MTALPLLALLAGTLTHPFGAGDYGRYTQRLAPAGPCLVAETVQVPVPGTSWRLPLPVTLGLQVRLSPAVAARATIAPGAAPVLRLDLTRAPGDLQPPAATTRRR